MAIRERVGCALATDIATSEPNYVSLIAPSTIDALRQTPPLTMNTYKLPMFEALVRRAVLAAAQT